MRARIIVLPGDGIGPEVVREAVRALRQVAEAFDHSFEFETHLIGAAAIDVFGSALPPGTLEACRTASAVLLGAVGDPRYDHLPPEEKVETGLLRLRSELGLFANLRPARLHAALLPAVPVKEAIAKGTDLVVVRELAGGLYYGQPRMLDASRGANTMAYEAWEVERIARVAFELARTRRRKVTSVDKANVLEASQLWRAVVTRVGRDYPDVALDHLYVDACAMSLMSQPTRFDVLLTENTFGDILSDEASVLCGSLGMPPSASLGTGTPLFEPIHGSAPALAGRDMANPIGAVASVAMLLRHALHLEAEAQAVETAIDRTLAEGWGTPDLAGMPRACGTRQLGDQICGRIKAPARVPA
jgi:3-isopropylmalate dehydrogenase